MGMRIILYKVKSGDETHFKRKIQLWLTEKPNMLRRIDREIF